MRKKTVLIIFSVILLLTSYGIFNLNTNKNINSNKSVLSTIENIKVDKDYNVELNEIYEEDNLTTYIFKLEKQNEEAFRLFISNEPLEIYIPEDRTTTLNFENIKVKNWFTGSIIHFFWQENDKVYYIRGDVNTILNYDNYLKIVDFFITNLKN